MAFQDRAESLVERLHLGSVPKPVFIAIAMAMAVMIVLTFGAFATAASGDFEVMASADGAQAAASPPDGDGAGGDGLASEGEDKPQGEAASARAAGDVVLPVAKEREKAQVCVHVDGCVASPGVYYLDAGSRVIDAVNAAGGAAEGAVTEAVNLAQEVQDGQQIVIPCAEEGDTSSSGTAGATDPTGAAAAQGGTASSGNGNLVNINTASAEEFETLKGVGAATAEKIVADREANGPFKSIEDLTRVSGIGEKKLAAMRDRLCL